MVASQAGGTTVYAFNHVLTLEVAYGLMLYSQRRQLHGAVARWYERLHGDDHPEMLGLLAHHWRCAEDAPRAAACLEKSALRSFSMGFAAAAVDHGLEAAQLLGVRLPRARPGLEQQLQAELQRIQGLLGERRPEQLLDLAPPKDEHANAVIGLLLRMEPAVHVSGQGVLFALIALRCMTLTLENGNGPEAPLAYAMFSIVHSALVRDSRTAFAFSRMALDLDKRQGGRLFVQVAFIHHYFNSHWLQPIDEGAEEVGRAADLGFANGDLLYACFNNSAEVICLAYAGRPLAEVMRLARRNEKRNGRRVLNAAFHCVLQLQFAKAMAGRTTGPLSLSDDEYDEQRELASARSSELHEEAGWYCVAKCRLCYLLGDFPAALQFARDAEPFLPVIARQPAGTGAGGRPGADASRARQHDAGSFASRGAARLAGRGPRARRADPRLGAGRAAQLPASPGLGRGRARPR